MIMQGNRGGNLIEILPAINFAIMFEKPQNSKACFSLKFSLIYYFVSKVSLYVMSLNVGKRPKKLSEIVCIFFTILSGLVNTLFNF